MHKIYILKLSCELYVACMYKYIVGDLSSFDKTTTKLNGFISLRHSVYIHIYNRYINHIKVTNCINLCIKILPNLTCPSGDRCEDFFPSDA